MPSRNKRNKNRPNTNTNANKNATTAKAAENTESNVTAEKEVESSQDLAEAEQKLAEIQQIVDAVKDSISNASAVAATINANAQQREEEEAPSTKLGEQKDEQQTLKKKRNRNRNRKKNSSNANESGVSSSSGTHESSPTNLTPIATLPAPNVVTEKIAEETNQPEGTVSLEKIESDCTKAESVETTIDKQQETLCDASTEEICKIPSQLDTNQFICTTFTKDDNLGKTATNVDEIEKGPQKLPVDPVKIDDNDNDHILDEQPLKCSTTTVECEKPKETHIEEDKPTERLELTATTVKEPENGKPSEKVEEQSKEDVGKSEVKHDSAKVEKSSPKTKNKNNTNQSVKEAKKPGNEAKKMEKKPPERTKPPEPIKQMKPAPLTSSKPSLEVEGAKIESETIEQTKVADSGVTATNENVTKAPTSTPIIATPAPELSKKPIQHEDETAKIWKILEDAAKSLEPVEIQMDDEPMINANDPPINETNAPILCSSKDQEQVEEKAKDLTALLQTTATDKTKTNVQSKPKTETIQSDAKPKPTNLAKSIDSHSQKLAEPTKADTKSIQKTPTQSESNQQVQVQVQTVQDNDVVKNPTEENRETTPESSLENLIQQSSPITTDISATILPADDMIPLDVSILPDHIDVPEMNTDSKNVQGSGFVPSVDQTAAETESLEMIATSVEIESNNNTSVDSNKGNALKPTTAQTQNNGTAPNASRKTRTSKVDDNETKIEIVEQSTAQEEKKQSNRTEKPNQNNSNPKNTPEKVSLNSKKSNAKPVIPPKPENLVSSHVKKAQAVSKKSAKMEKILVVTGANAMDGEDSEDDYIEYKFMPRPVFIATICQLCKTPNEMNNRTVCQLCHMVSYCNAEHAAKDEPQHKDLCAAFQEIAKKRGTFWIFEWKVIYMLYNTLTRIEMNQVVTFTTMRVFLAIMITVVYACTH